MQYDVHVKRVAPAVAATKRTHTTLAELGHTMHATLATIAGAVQPPGGSQAAPFAIYHNEPFRPDDIDVEVGVPLAPGASVASSGVSARALPGGDVAYTIHVGSYQTIGAAYGAIEAWLAEHGLRAAGPPREIYLVGPGPQTRPEEYRTEIEIPVAGAAS